MIGGAGGGEAHARALRNGLTSPAIYSPPTVVCVVLTVLHEAWSYVCLCRIGGAGGS